MKLIDILVRDLPKRGGWLNGMDQCAQDDSGEVCFYTEGEIKFRNFGVWSIPVDSGATHDVVGRVAMQLADDYKTTIITRDQYEAALADSKPKWDGEGLPPVGCECELSNAVEFYTHSGTTDFEEGTSVVVGGTVNFGLGDFVAVKVKGTNCITDINPCFLRPIRSAAEKKRDEVGLALYHAINWNAEGELVSPSRMEDYKKAYDAIAAGKIPHIRID